MHEVFDRYVPPAAKGFLPSEWAVAIWLTLIVTLIVVTAWRKRLRGLLFGVGLTWAASTLVISAVFLPLFAGIGSPVASIYRLLSQTVSWRADWEVVVLWSRYPIFALAALSLAVYCVLVSHERTRRLPWHLVTAIASIQTMFACTIRFGSLLRLVQRNSGIVSPGITRAVISNVIVEVVILATIMIVIFRLKHATHRYFTITAITSLGALNIQFIRVVSAPSITLATTGVGEWLFDIGFVIMLVGSILEIRRAPPPPSGLCVGCGYDLRGLTSNRCPECGRVFAGLASTAM